MMMRSAALVVAFTISAGGSAAAEDAGKNIMLANERSAVEGCRFLEQLQSKSLWGGFAATGLAYNKAMSALKRKAATLNATHIVLINSSNTVGGTNMIGDAYSCPKKDVPANVVAPAPAAPG